MSTDWGGGEEAAPEDTRKLRELLEIGSVIIADWTDEYMLFRGMSIAEAQEPDAPPFAKIVGGVEGKKIAVLVGFIVAEHMRDGRLELPEFLTDGFKSANELIADAEPGADGNTGTVSDNVSVKLVGVDGKELSS